MPKLERGQTALVTGASAGIGRAFARALAWRGLDVVLVARDVARLEALAVELAASGVRADVLAADLGQPAELARVEERLRAAPVVDLLVNNAGLGAAGGFADVPIAALEAQIRVNIVAPTRLAHAALSGMRARRSGGLIQISSGAAFVPLLNNATYSGTKAYLSILSLTIAEELRHSGVAVLTVSPGFTRTEFQQRARADASEVPALFWQSAEAVVDASLAAYEAGRSFVVTGAHNKLAVALGRLVPLSWLGRVVGLVARLAPQSAASPPSSPV